MRNLLLELERLLHELPEGDLQALVDFGQDLWTLSAKVQSAQERVKAALRQDALARSGGKPGRVVLEGRHSRCTVVVPPATLRLREGFTTEDLQRRLGPDFDKLFRVSTQVVPRENLSDGLDSCPNDVVAVLAEMMNLTADPPRVSFQED